MKAWLVAAAVIVALAPRAARADDFAHQVALLPLDADQQLDIYGQPVASAIAHALTAAGVDVIVVGAKASVPKVRLILDGHIAAQGNDSVLLSIRVRYPEGDVVKTLPTKPTPLVSIDKAAAELAAELLPVVKAELAKPARTSSRGTSTMTVTNNTQLDNPTITIAPAAPPSALAVAVVGDAALAAPLRAAVEPWARHHARAPHALPPPPTAGAQIDLVKAVAGEGVPLGIALEVVSYAPVAGVAPMARARVHVQIASATQVLFDRVIATDTVVGNKAMAADALAARVAAEVLAILGPHFTRTVPSWGR